MRICLVVTIILRMLAVFFLVAGFLLYETAEKRIGDTLIGWWVRLDDARSAAVSKTTAFMRGVGRILSTGFDTLFGERILSLRSIGISLGVSLYFTAASFFLFGAYADFKLHLAGKPSGSPTWDIVRCLLFIVAGVSPAFVRERWFTIVWAAVIVIGGRVLLYFGYLIFVKQGMHLAARYAEAVVTLLAISYCFDLIYIMTIRRILRVVQDRHSIGIVLMFLGSVILSLIFIVAPILVSVKLINVSRVPIVVAIGSLVVNSIDIVACWLGVVVALFILVHRFFFWPLILKPLYSVARLDITSRRALLWGIGICLWNNQIVLNLICKK